MSNYAIVGDEKVYNTTKLTSEIARVSNNEVILSQNDLYIGIDGLIDEMKTGVIHTFDNLQSILVLDLAFKDISNPKQSALEFMELQDMMSSLGMRKVKLYLFTKNSDLYYLLQGDVDGFPGLSYPQAEIMLFHNQAIADLVRVMRGEFDGSGKKTKIKKSKTRVEQYEENKEILERESRQVSQEVLEFEKEMQESRLNRDEYINSPQHQKKMAEMKKEASKRNTPLAEGEVFRSEEGEKPVPKVEKSVPKVDILNLVEDDETSHYVPRKPYEPLTVEAKPVNVSPYHSVTVPKMSDLNEVFNQLQDEGMGVVERKLQGDVAIILVTSLSGEGGSSLTAQIADAYAMVGRKVCIFDLDLDKRSQSRLYLNYDKKVADRRGLKNAILNVADGGDVEKASVSVNSRVSVCGLSQTFSRLEESRYLALEKNIGNVLLDALDTFDILLIDCPMHLLPYYIPYFNEVDRVLFACRNTQRSVEELLDVRLNRLLKQFPSQFSVMLANGTIVLNQFQPFNRDHKGVLVDTQYVKSKLAGMGTAFESLLVTGEIPYTERFDDQYLTNKRYIWDDKVYSTIIKKMLNEAI